MLWKVGDHKILLVAITETAEFLLACSIPNVEANWAVVRVKHHGMHFDTHRGNVASLKFTGDVALHEGSLSYTSVSDEDQLELRDGVSSSWGWG